MTDLRSWYRLLQITDGTFPTGGFSQSWGLETYVSEGLVHDIETFRAFLDSYLSSGIGRCEGPLILRARQIACRRMGREGHPFGGLCPRDDLQEESIPCQDGLDSLHGLEELSRACKVTGESREGSIRMGRAFLRILRQMLAGAGEQDEKEEGEKEASEKQAGEGKPLAAWLDALLAESGYRELTYPVAYGLAIALLELDPDEALVAYIFSTANTLTQSALKLIPLGNGEAQGVLFELESYAGRIACLCRETKAEEISNFCPGIDIASLRHEALAVRLYMS